MYLYIHIYMYTSCMDATPSATLGTTNLQSTVQELVDELFDLLGRGEVPRLHL